MAKIIYRVKKLKVKSFKNKIGIIILSLGVFFFLFSILYKPLISRLLVSKLAFSKPKNLQSNNQNPNKYPVKLLISKQKINLNILSQKIIDKNWPISDQSANYLIGSGLPGEKGNLVIYGHNQPGVFANLKDTKVNDLIVLITRDKKVFRYRVKEKRIVSPFETEIIEPSPNEILTIYTCFGFFDSQRLVIIAERKS